LLEASMPEIEAAVAGLSPLRRMRSRLYLLDAVGTEHVGPPPAAMRAFERVVRELQSTGDNSDAEGR
jgi:hypothetical protein